MKVFLFFLFMSVFAHTCFSYELKLKAVSKGERATLIAKARTALSGIPKEHEEIDFFMDHAFSIRKGKQTVGTMIPVNYLPKSSGVPRANARCALVFIDSKSTYYFDVIGIDDTEAITCDQPSSVGAVPTSEGPKLAIIFKASGPHESVNSPTIIFYNESTHRFEYDSKTSVMLDETGVQSIDEIRRKLKRSKG